MSRFQFASYENMTKSESVIIIGAGPSLEKVMPKLIKWKNENNPIVIGAHYGYKIKPKYTVFTTPNKFLRAQGKIPGRYIVGPRIKDKNIKRKWRHKVLRMNVHRCGFEDWDNSDFITKDGKIPQNCNGFQAIILSVFCNPSRILLAGFDGFDLIGNRVVIRHAKNCTLKAKPASTFYSLSKKKYKTILNKENKRKKILIKLFRYLHFKKNIQISMFNEDRFRNINKNDLSDKFGVEIL